MGLVRCLTDKRHKPYQINTLVYIFLLFKSTREFSRYSLAKKSDICRWCVFTHSLCNPIFFFVLRKKIAPLVFYLVPPISLFLSNACLFFASRKHSLSHQTLWEQNFENVFFFIRSFWLCLSLTLNLPLSKAPFESNSGLKRIHGFLCFI